MKRKNLAVSRMKSGIKTEKAACQKLPSQESRLTERGITSDEIVRDEHQRQGASNVTVRNIITSMRLISDVNWQDLARRSPVCWSRPEPGSYGYQCRPMGEGSL